MVSTGNFLTVRSVSFPTARPTIDDLDDVTLAFRGKNAADPERREKYFLLISQHKDAAGDTINVPVHINKTGRYNRVFIPTNKIATVYGKIGLNDYLQRQVRNGNLVRVKIKGTQASEDAAPIAARYSSDSYDTTVPQDVNGVNRKLSDREKRIISHSETYYQKKIADLKTRIQMLNDEVGGLGRERGSCHI